MATIIPDRLAQLDTITLNHGAHDDFAVGHCAMEVVAWLVDDDHTDHPACVCPSIGAFVRSWNDALPDADRQRILKPFLPRLVDTASTPDVQDARAFLAADWAVRVFTPAWLRKAGLDAEAAELEGLPVLSSVELCRAAMPTISRARQRAAAAGVAAGDAAGAAARDAAWAAAGAAAGDAAWAAARAAARAAAWDAARAAAWDAAWDAARAAAWDALADTVVELQSSAADLLDRMIKAGTDA